MLPTLVVMYFSSPDGSQISPLLTPLCSIKAKGEKGKRARGR